MIEIPPDTCTQIKSAITRWHEEICHLPQTKINAILELRIEITVTRIFEKPYTRFFEQGGNWSSESVDKLAKKHLIKVEPKDEQDITDPTILSTILKEFDLRIPPLHRQIQEESPDYGCADLKISVRKSKIVSIASESVV